jgi:hypothetical protein
MTPKKIKFEDLKEGDKFHHNSFDFIKGGGDKGETIHKIVDGEEKEFPESVNATCISNDLSSSYFAPYIKVKPGVKK